MTGSFDTSSTGFRWFGIEEFNLQLNGNSCNGFPIQVKREGSILPLNRFNDVTGRLYNIEFGSGLTLNKFATNYIWAHKFEAEQSSQGWIGLSLKLNQILPDNTTLVVWLITRMALSIDRYHRIERVLK